MRKRDDKMSGSAGQELTKTERIELAGGALEAMPGAPKR